MDYKKIKCVILDFDNTLYSDGDWSGEIKFFDRFLKKDEVFASKGINGKQLLKMYPKYHIIQAIYAYLRENNLDSSKIKEFDNNNVCNILSDNIRFIDSKVLEDLSKHYLVYMISDSSTKYLEYYMDYAKIDKKSFTKYLSNQYDDEDFSKIPMMKLVLKETKMKPNEIIMIGDSETHDIEPAKSLGLQTYLVDDVCDTEKVLKNLIEIKTRFN